MKTFLKVTLYSVAVIIAFMVMLVMLIPEETDAEKEVRLEQVAVEKEKLEQTEVQRIAIAKQQLEADEVEQQKQKEASNLAEKEKQLSKEREEAQNQKGLGITYDQLISSIKNNKLTQDIDDLTFKVSSENTKDSGITIVNTEIKHNAMYLLTDAKENKDLTSLTLITSGDGSMKSGIDIMMGMVSMMQSIDTSLTAKQATKVIMDELNLGDLITDGETYKFTRKGVKYSLSKSSMLGTWLIISPG